MSGTEKLLVFGGLGAAAVFVYLAAHPINTNTGIGSYLKQETGGLAYAHRNLHVGPQNTTPPTVFVYGNPRNQQVSQAPGLL